MLYLLRFLEYEFHGIQIALIIWVRNNPFFDGWWIPWNSFFSQFNIFLAKILIWLVLIAFSRGHRSKFIWSCSVQNQLLWSLQIGYFYEFEAKYRISHDREVSKQVYSKGLKYFWIVYSQELGYFSAMKYSKFMLLTRSVNLLKHTYDKNVSKRLAILWQR